jgi:hypothetical protein
MSEEEAVVEAKRRWGVYAKAWVGFGGKCCVRSGHGVKGGVGNSWEEAFADADRRQKEQP